MTNPHRGDTSIKVGGEDFTLCYDLNATQQVFERLGVDSFEKMTAGIAVDKLGVGDIIYILWAGLQRHHPEMTVKDVGALEWDLQGINDTWSSAFERALVVKAPEETVAAPAREGKKDGPPTRSGTGKESK